ncbi:hypothetical protein GCM10023259_101040 [Thermocatellispora tengchongensis]
MTKFGRFGSLAADVDAGDDKAGEADDDAGAAAARAAGAAPSRGRLIRPPVPARKARRVGEVSMVSASLVIRAGV